MHPENKKTAVRYWERRRIIYNLLLIPPAIFGWGIAGAVSASGDEKGMGTLGVLLLFFSSAIGANICYSLAYVFEFLFAGSGRSFWPKPGRTIVFICGCAFAVFLAMLGGRNIALIQYSY